MYLFSILAKVIISISFCTLVHCQRSEFGIIKATQCNIPGLKVITENATIRYQHSKSYISARVHVLDNIKALKSMHAVIERCNNEGLHCEHIQNIKVDRLCQILTSLTERFWSSIVKQMHPPIRCPIKKMTYEIQNANLDLQNVSIWYPDVFKYRWRITVKVFNERNTIIYCEIFDIDTH